MSKNKRVRGAKNVQGKRNKARNEMPMANFEMVINSDGSCDVYKVDKHDPVQITKDLIYNKWGLYIAKESDWDEEIKEILIAVGTPEAAALSLKCIADVADHLDNLVKNGIDINTCGEEELKAMCKEKFDNIFAE